MQQERNKITFFVSHVIDDFDCRDTIPMVKHRRQSPGMIIRSVACTTKDYCCDHFQTAPPVASLDGHLRKVASPCSSTT